MSAKGIFALGKVVLDLDVTAFMTIGRLHIPFVPNRLSS
jgi:hypothetical protein